MRDLSRYRQKRDFSRTAEPAGGVPSGGVPRYSIQNHAATRLHWDLRLEHDGVLLSWAVTRGPSLDPADKRLAVRTEDHPLDYLAFEGQIPQGSYGAGTVMLWDIGWWQPLHPVDDGLARGHLHFALHGQRLTGNWSLVRMAGGRPGDAGRENWLMLKEDDPASRAPDPVARYRTSITTGRSLDEIAGDVPAHPAFRPRKGTRPRFHAPQLAELHAIPPDGGDWWHEVKLDGYRAQVALGKGGPRIYTRSGLDWTDRFPPLLPGLDALPADTALIDGEIVAGAGQDRFGDIGTAIRHGGPFVYYAFDLLHLDGRNLRAGSLQARRKRLETLFADVVPRGMLRLSPILDGAGSDLFARIDAAGGEGLVSKLRSAPYRSGRSSSWVKTKTERRGAFVIIGWQHSTARGQTLASLLLASHQDGGLAYRGKVGTGLAGKEDDLLFRLADLARTDCPLRKTPPLDGKVTWVTPHLVAEVRFAEITRGGHLRQASFLALRDDKALAEVTTEGMEEKLRLKGITITHPRRRVFPEPSVTKGQIAEYYAAVADRMLQVARTRPLSLLRLPDGLEGESFFQKHLGKGFPDALREVEFQDDKGKHQSRMYLSTQASLLAAVQMGAVEFHVEGVRIDRPLQPDRMILDLDPDEGLGFDAVRDAAVLLRDVLGEAGFKSWAMVSGGKGVHVVVPLRRTADTASVALFSRLVATLLAEAQPKRFTQKMAKAERTGRIFIDWLRNDGGSTAVAPFSLRARPGAPVAVPVSWDEVPHLPGADAFGMAEALKRSWDEVQVPAPGAITARSAARLAAAVRAL